MRSELKENISVERPTLVVEILGPAGVGKTTLLRALSQRHGKIQPDIDIRLSKIKKFPYFIGNTLTFLPIHLRHYRHSRWFDWRETRSMAYLQAGLSMLRRQAADKGSVTLLDHGPIYRLAFLREFGPQVTTSQRYKRWWSSLLNQWMTTLDMVIWLDAPNAVLLERIHARDRWHTIEAETERDAHEILNRYRTSFERTFAESVTGRQVTRLRFDTNQESTEQIADKVLATFDSAAATVTV